MSQKTSIEWTDATWNPVRGCSRVSEGCRNCYAERTAARFAGTMRPYADRPLEGLALATPPPFAGFVTKVNGHPAWTGKVELIEKHLEDPLHWGDPKRIFVNSMSDLFHEELDDESISTVFAVMSQSPQHTFQILTKRPKRMLEWFSRWNVTDGVEESGMTRFGWCHANTDGRWPLPNVWLGVSVEDQATADERIPLLLQTPAAVRFVSYEPALGPVEFTAVGEPPINALWKGGFRDGRIDWVIAGGESGPGARPAHPQWFRDVRDQCQAAGVPFFFKQWGEHAWIGCNEPQRGPGVSVASFLPGVPDAAARRQESCWRTARWSGVARVPEGSGGSHGLNS